MGKSAVRLVVPNKNLVDSFIEARKEGLFRSMALGGFGDDRIEDIERDVDGYLMRITDKNPRLITMNNGACFHLTDHELLWATDECRFIGTVALRYDGDRELIESYAGNIGVAIRSSLLNRGYGLKAAREAWKNGVVRMKEKGMTEIFASCDPDNAPSRRLIEHFGGVLASHQEDCYGEGPNLVYRIALDLR